MNRKLLLFVALFLLLPTFIFAQEDTPAPNYKKKESTIAKKKQNGKDYFDESGGWKHRLWYGTGGTLNFGTTSFGERILSLGISPMVGYKIVEKVSVGPRVAIDFTKYYYRDNSGQAQTLSLTDYTFSAFVRAKIFQGLFLQGEGGIQSFEIPDANNQKHRESRNPALIGAGYSSSNNGVGLGYEISALYDVNLTADQITRGFNPLSFRLAFTYNF